MSVWTHVAAVARIDWLYPLSKEECDFRKIFGKECCWGAPHEVWVESDEHPERFLPMGSEGSLDMSVWTNPDACCSARYTVSIFGDLRDFDDARGVVEWFRGKLKDLWVRQAVITAETEFRETVSWTFVDGVDTEPVSVYWKESKE